MASLREQHPVQKERNAALLERLLRGQGDRLRRQARFHSGRPEDAEDALGDACVQFLLHFEGRDGEEARRWMLVVVKRCAWAIGRRCRERRAVVKEVSAERLRDELGVSIPDLRGEPARLVEVREEVASALAGLKPDERRALLLVAAGYTLAEAASVAGWTYTKIKRCTYEGRGRLRRVRAEEGEET